LPRPYSAEAAPVFVELYDCAVPLFLDNDLILESDVAGLLQFTGGELWLVGCAFSELSFITMFTS